MSRRKRICYNCTGENYLKEFVRIHGKAIKCSYCKEKQLSILIEKLAYKIEYGFTQFYERSANEPSSLEYRLMSDKESRFSWERHGDPIIQVLMDVAEIDEEIASDIQGILEEKNSDYESAEIGLETEFSTDSYYQSKILEDESWQGEWAEFEKKLKNEARHFNQFGIKLLDRIFEGIETLETEDGNTLVTVIGPKNPIHTLYRARVFHTDRKLQEALTNPDQQLGPPPKMHALAGRMNARGISMFYGAIKKETAIGEVRPPVGSKVVVSKFTVLKELKLLNLNALKNVSSRGSIFNPDFIKIAKRDIFLRRLSARMSTPVMPDDEPMDYLITQAIADYLAVESEQQFDGILYPSVQSDNKGINVVLFNKSSRVSPYLWNLDVSLNSYTDEGWVYDYQIRKKGRKKKAVERKYYDDFLNENVEIPIDKDKREFTLSVDISEIWIHHVSEVQFFTKSHDIYIYK
ncbi:RES family NAD+ phosphorylase [Sphingobacterium multivorum]|jgi:hypothetical protein|uniref:RES family NAD+ phosphorylase n=1 Tax=Sphingobacterium multivorum TaxID=28454 RepID=UPI000E9407A3|nr:RES family NAD+ phosphorylase [Sphingobacterium multivorum]HBX62675.1 hypothetical protein [Flavobacteriaceae bacterium]